MRFESARGNWLTFIPVKKLNAIPDGTTNKKEIESLKKLKTIQLGLSNKMDSMILKTFTLYQ